MSHEPIFNYWRLFALVALFTIIIPLGYGVEWAADEVLPKSVTDFGAGVGIGIAITLIVQRWDEKRQRN